MRILIAASLGFREVGDRAHDQRQVSEVHAAGVRVT
jgi:hypothetical protein